MKKYLFLTLIIFTFCDVDIDQHLLLEKKQGPALNAKNGGLVSCSDRYVINGTNSKWLDESGGEFMPNGVSDCVDLQLWSKPKDKYYDHCCYVRFQLKGKMHAGCIGLNQENYLDTSVTMKRMEKGDRDIWTRNAEGSKIYQLDCYASYLKIASIFLLALFL